MRLFIAFDIPTDITEYLVEIQKFLRKEALFEGSFLPKQNFHITVLFLGDKAEVEMPGIIDLINAIPPVVPSMLELVSVDLNRTEVPSVIWVTLRCAMLNEMFVFLSATVHSENSQNDVFTPHMTLARVKKLLYPEILSKVLKEIPPRTLVFQPKEIILKQSQLTQQGAVYTDIYAHPLTYITQLT